VSAGTWLEHRERGTVFLIRATCRLTLWTGRPFMRVGVACIALWYRIFDRRTARASRAWLTRVHGRPPGFWDVYRHVRTFVQVTLDRVFLLTGRTDGLAFTRSGNEHLQRLRAAGRGALLLGAHLGSFEAMRASGVIEDIPIHILGYFRNSERINALLAGLHAGQAARVIHLGDPVGAIVRAKARVDAGEFVALLGDRVGLNERVVKARFLGAEAAFPAGPFLLAASIGCPVLLVFGLYRAPNRYDLHCEPFAERLLLPRKEREQRLALEVQRYAQRLEDYCRRAPDNWFNFFDFWRNP
jgi:predicted LPLAT superfamily acyltransferase